MEKTLGNPNGDKPVIVHGPLPTLRKQFGFWYCEVPGLLIGRGFTFMEAYKNYLRMNGIDEHAVYLGV